jgi:hypothetical protein
MTDGTSLGTSSGDHAAQSGAFVIRVLRLPSDDADPHTFVSNGNDKIVGLHPSQESVVLVNQSETLGVVLVLISVLHRCAYFSELRPGRDLTKVTSRQGYEALVLPAGDEFTTALAGPDQPRPLTFVLVPPPLIPVA